MNETINVLLKRRSIRKYSDKEVEMEKLETICKAGSFAASGNGLQSPFIICITNKDDLNAMEKINAEVMGKSDAHPFYGANAAILVVADAESKHALPDGALVMGNLMNAAASLGLGSCWINRAKETFEREDGKSYLKKWGLNGKYIGIGFCIVGYTDENVLSDGKERKEGYIRYIK